MASLQAGTAFMSVPEGGDYLPAAFSWYTGRSLSGDTAEGALPAVSAIPDTLQVQSREEQPQEHPETPPGSGSDPVSDPSGIALPAVNAIPDTLQVQSREEQPQEHPEIPPGSGSDPVSDPSGIALPGLIAIPESLPVTDSVKINVPSDQESIWDRIDSRNREIQSAKTETPVMPGQDPAPVPRVIVPEKTSERSYDTDTLFLAPGKDIIFSREHIFPDILTTASETEAGTIVFIESGNPAAGNSSVAYRTYLEAEASDYDPLQYSTSWIPGLVILSLLLLAWIKLAYVQFLTPVLISTFNYKEALKLYISKNAPAQNALVILHLIFALNSGLFLLFIARHFHLNVPDIRPAFLFLIASASIVLLFGLKNAMLRITGFLFDSPKLFAEYSHNISLYNKILGILLMPLIVGLLYADIVIHNTLIYTGLTMIVAFYLLQLIRGMEIIARKGFSVFYLILYLCAFEIIPIFMLYRLFDTFLL
jgi:hypothetical protein